jgi:DNA-binding NtrC family response regulator
VLRARTQWPVLCRIGRWTGATKESAFGEAMEDGHGQLEPGDKPGISDFLHQPIAGDWIRAEQLTQGCERINGMVVRSEHARRLLRTIARLSQYKATVLIQGESGTGKELVARALHNLGTRPNGPFVTFNCSNLVESLAESQLFGHVKGAFTDAREDSLGYFRAANGGTLFLDEIAELPLRLQPKLLRAVETHEVQPVGSAQCFKSDIRLIAATNRDLRTMVAAGLFRDDLFYRLSAAAVMVAPLRDRREAIPALTGFFIEHYNHLFGKQVSQISRRALEALCAYRWPGNIRELSHAVESAVLLTESDRITVADLSEQICRGAIVGDAPSVPPLATASAAPNLSDAATSPILLDDVIKQALARALEQTQGNRRRAASLLGVSRSTLYRMLARYEMADLGRNRSAARIPI